MLKYFSYYVFTKCDTFIIEFQSYVHRSGRTARAQKEGITVLMMEPSEKQYYSRLCKTLNRSKYMSR